MIKAEGIFKIIIIIGLYIAFNKVIFWKLLKKKNINKDINKIFFFWKFH